MTAVCNTPQESLKNSKHLNTKEVSKKRKRISLQAQPSQLKRLKAHYNDDYRQLYNETVKDIVYESPSQCQKVLEPSQIGITIWSSGEKETFFTALAKRGRGDLSGIARAIGTKSEFEVHVYLKLLQDAVVREHLFNRRNQLFDVSAAPAAFEVSAICSAALEISAEALGVLQQRAEDKLQKKKHHDLWLLNQKAAGWAISCLRRGPKGENEVRERLPAAELLDLEMYLNLSTNVFMNSSEGDGNWREYCYKNEKPAISFTAFSDFHTLAVSITRRLIQSSLFFAMSRLRATTVSKFTPQQAVRRQDITAALDVLGMKHNSQKFWTGVATRCALNVFDDDGNDDPLSFPEVEKRLSEWGSKGEDDGFQNRNSDNTKGCSATPRTVTSLSSLEEDSDVSGYTSDCSTGSSSESIDSSSDLPTNPPDAPRSNQNPDIYAEALDAKASLQEEQRLWNLLGKLPPSPLDADAIRVPRAPTGERKIGDDLDDWRVWVNYAPEWESNTDPISKSFIKNRRPLKLKGRKRLRGRGVRATSEKQRYEVQNIRTSQASGSDSENEHEESPQETSSSEGTNDVEQSEQNAEAPPGSDLEVEENLFRSI
jgi:RNA polymerase I-specific transcription initiation factor RRN5